MNQTYDWIVLGRGIVGLSAAIALNLRGAKVLILDAGNAQTDAAQLGQRVYAMNQASSNFFQSMGLWAYIDQNRMQPYRQMLVWDSQNKQEIEFDSRMLALDKLGLMFEEGCLHSASIQRAQDLDIPCVRDWQTLDIKTLEHAVSLSSATDTYSAQGLIAADGAHSPTRALLGIETISWPYRQRAIVAKVRTDLPHQGRAFQIFRPQGPLAFLPMTNPHESSIVWSTSEDEASALLAATPEDFERQLAAAFQLRLGPTHLESTRQHFSLHMQHVKFYTVGRCVLMGDAAHSIHPMAGLGLNMGIQDLTQWLTLFPKLKPPIHSEKVNLKYQRQRKHTLWQTILVLEALHRLFGQDNLPVNLLRSAGLKIFNQLSWVKRQLIEHAMGLSGEH